MKILGLYSKIVVNLLLALKGVRIEILDKNNKELFDSVGMLRKQVYVEHEYIKEDEAPDIYLDDFDRTAIIFVAVKKRKAIGTVRLAFKQPGMLLPSERWFNLKNPLHKDSIEVTKMAIKKQYRGGKRLVFIGLFQSVLNYCKDNNQKNLIAVLPSWFYESLCKTGIKVSELLVDKPSEANLYERNTNMKGYFDKQSISVYNLELN